MTHRLLALGLALAFGLATGPSASAQSRAGRALDDWSAVQTLSAGQKIVVRTKDGDRLTGRFDSANDLLINFTDGGRKISLTRESIKLVQLDRGNSRGKGFLFGAAVGAATGFAAGSVFYFPFRDDMVGATVPVSAAMGAAIGGGIGAATGKGNKNETVYEAP
ncbi:MAG: hypothetical protein ABW208_11965 [Pyrinomonadaceae bacterium]